MLLFLGPSLINILLLPHALSSSFYDNPEQDALHPQGSNSAEDLHQKWDFEWGFSGISTFAHLPHTKCLSDPLTPFDIGIIGAPFDTAVSYRPGARFGPRAIRAASARQTAFRGFNPRRRLNPYISPLKILDCGDIPITPFDNALAITQMTSAFLSLGARAPALLSSRLKTSPKLLTLGGDHSIALPALRALHKLQARPITVVHFDAHLDTWHPSKYPSGWPQQASPAQSDFTHGSMFWLAAQEGLIANGTSIHAGLRTRLASADDWTDDTGQGFQRISADDIDDIGPSGVISQILARVGSRDEPVYLSVDIDVVDPGLCPGTGTPEPGGWTSRELIRILRGLEELNVVGADIVEVAPVYDGVGEQTSLVAAQIGFEIITSWVARRLVEMEKLEGSQREGGSRDEL